MRKSNIKVLWVLGNLSTGGVETWLKSIYQDLFDNGVEIHVLVTNPNTRGDMYPIFQRLGVKVILIPYSARRIFSFTKALLQLVKLENYKIIHEQGEFVGCLKYLLMPNIRKILFVHIHSSYSGVKEYYFRKRLFNEFLWKISFFWFKKSKFILSTSQQSLIEFNLHQRLNVRTLYCSVRQDFLFRDRVEKSIDILFLGRIDEHRSFSASNNHKNSWFAINVMINCLAVEPNLNCVFVGGPEDRLIELSHQRLSGIEKIHFHSATSDPLKYFSKTKVFIFPSKHEGLGLVAVEAQLQDCFVLASDKVPIETRISDNITYLPLNNTLEWSSKVLDVLRLAPDSHIDRIKFSPFESSKNIKYLYEHN
jgi:hypothetical protein